MTDVLTGYFAWTRKTMETLRPHLVSEGFAIEMEMITKMAKLGDEIYCVPISYHARAGESNLRPFYDGSRILSLLIRNIFWKPESKRKKKIAYVSDSILPFHHGGKERRLYEITRRMVREDQEIHIYTMKWWKGPNAIELEGVHLHALSKFHPLYVKNRRSITQALIFGLATLKLFFMRFDELDVDHMPFFPLFSARVVTWLRRKKLYATWHEVWGRKYWMEYLGGLGGLFGYITEELAFLMPDVIISNSVHTTDRLRRTGVTKEIETIPLGVDLKEIYAAPTSEKVCDVIFVGRLLSHKNPDLLVKAIAQVKASVPTIQCRIIGTGPEKGTVLSLIEQLQLQGNIELLEPIESHRELYGMLKASRMLVLPSVREGFGLTVVEANAAGIPVITTSHENNAAKDLILEGVNGLLVEPNETDIANKIVQLLNRGADMDVRRDIEQYDWSRVVKHLEQAMGLRNE